MRRAPLVLVLATAAAAAVCVYQLWTLLTLLLLTGDQLRDAISRDELPALSDTDSGRPLLIPKILHQIWIAPGWSNGSVPDRWRDIRLGCLDMHTDYEYKLWTGDTSRGFIEAQYPWFLTTWDAYPFDIQRADAIRYFALEHYGGVYLDLDDGCQRRLDPLLSYRAWAQLGHPTGISNDAIGAVPGHPFFRQVIAALPRHNRSWLLPYITIMSSTGPLFLSIVWRRYNSRNPPAGDRLRILYPAERQGQPWSFFIYHKGQTWHQWDAEAIFWCHRNWIWLTMLVLCLVCLVVFGVSWCTGRASLQRQRRLAAWKRGRLDRVEYHLISQQRDV